MKRENLISMALAAITLVGPVVQSGPKKPGRPGRGRYALDALSPDFAWGECRPDDWQCSPSGEHLAYVGEVDDDFANSNDPVDEDSTKPPILATSPAPSNSNSTRITKRSVGGSGQDDINAILVKILDRIVKAQEDPSERDIDPIWTALLERLVKAHEDAAKPSNPWTAPTKLTAAASIITLVIGVLNFFKDRIISLDWRICGWRLASLVLWITGWEAATQLKDRLSVVEKAISGRANVEPFISATALDNPMQCLKTRVANLNTDLGKTTNDTTALGTNLGNDITRLDKLVADKATELEKLVTDKATELEKLVADKAIELKKLVGDNDAELEKRVDHNMVKLEDRVKKNTADLGSRLDEKSDEFSKKLGDLETSLQVHKDMAVSLAHN
ncbi:hypothetical protein CGCF415_v015038 [Colletotrichum fructicola]|uniref:Uncharacterized protein n=1 Tax=Colletotrichum fructicola (strain Nara gc5) TaxID=1213859 RepID=L2FVA4_COLFN|nr:hypothetical protein CFRS1_v005558 [Colletotrichum fructicola]KAF4474838.1 hypothetical protein CGGC5_v015803 [Colletotrichum fructicola Nara gc5]KAF4884936.1 hypothetical protein CGCFRS4_v012339 [Colletotrichum fructicola]KAF4886860.1 hypothetical protein CGCF415_v015038 [Colletotrichum fructicola]KAF4934730.1 hypothetical protein CGCF245_v008317 [Colletotrichum fructicola]